MWILKLRVGKEFYPVSWPEGRICWPESPYKPTTFDISGRLEAETEVRASAGKGNYIFEHTEKQPPQSMPGDVEPTLLIQFPVGGLYDT